MFKEFVSCTMGCADVAYRCVWVRVRVCVCMCVSLLWRAFNGEDFYCTGAETELIVKKTCNWELRFSHFWLLISYTTIVISTSIKLIYHNITITIVVNSLFAVVCMAQSSSSTAVSVGPGDGGGKVIGGVECPSPAAHSQQQANSPPRSVVVSLQSHFECVRVYVQMVRAWVCVCWGKGVPCAR
jgi:hypothetical protein